VCADGLTDGFRFYAGFFQRGANPICMAVLMLRGEVVRIAPIVQESFLAQPQQDFAGNFSKLGFQFFTELPFGVVLPSKQFQRVMV
jgi:hypothetical protein